MLKIVTLITVILTFILLNLGGLVHNTGSSLACPDWPLCYGQVFPKMEGGILIEHSHRLLASLVGFLTILLVILASKQEVKKIKKITWLALTLVIFQGLLGGLTVIYQLPTLVSTAHLGISIIFFCTLLYLWHLACEKEQGILPSHWNFSFKHQVFGLFFLVYFQMLMGALLRHLGAGVACGLGYNNSIQCFDITLWKYSWLPSSSASLLHMCHRYFAVLIAVLILFSQIKFLKNIKNYISSLSKKDKSFLVYFPCAIVILVLVQVLLGIMTVGSALGITITTLHLGVAVLLIGHLWEFYLFLNSLEKKSNPKKKDTFISDIFSLTKPRLSSLVIFTMGAGMLLAPGTLSILRGVVAVLTTSLIVAGACAINCYMEKDVDALMERTKERPLPAKRLPAFWGLAIGTTLIVVFLPILYFVDPLTALLALIACIIYIFFYTPLKLVTPLALFVGAIPGAIPPLMGWTLVTGKLEIGGWILFAILFVWQLPHFLAIALCYAKDYENAGIKVFPNEKGVPWTRRKIIFYTFILILLSVKPLNEGMQTLSYKVMALILGFLFLLVALWGLKAQGNDLESKRMSRNYFFATIIYLPLIFLLMIFV
ncbi:MAG: heme o synthase [Bacteriovoracaceae bacterium]|nr:heme o synthase [Bacteriovoracaceae bacterium]